MIHTHTDWQTHTHPMILRSLNHQIHSIVIMTHGSVCLEVLPSTAAVALCGAALAACGRKAETVGERFKPWNRLKNMVNSWMDIHRSNAILELHIIYSYGFGQRLSKRIVWSYLAPATSEYFQKRWLFETICLCWPAKGLGDAIRLFLHGKIWWLNSESNDHTFTKISHCGQNTRCCPVNPSHYWPPWAIVRLL